MTEQEIRAVIAEIADELQEQHTALSTDLPKDEEGFNVPDGSDLSDALLAIDRAVMRLSRLSGRISRDPPERT